MASDLNASVKDGHKFGKKISLWSRCVEVGSSTEEVTESRIKDRSQTPDSAKHTGNGQWD